MKKIYEYTLNLVDKQVIEIPSRTILSVMEQANRIVVYAIHEPNIVPIKYEFTIIGTGDTINSSHSSFLGTVKMHHALIFHIFYAPQNH